MFQISKKKKIINYYTLRPLCPLNLISPTWPITTVIIWVCLSIIPIKQIILYNFYKYCTYLYSL